MGKIITLTRTVRMDEATLGHLAVYDELKQLFTCKTLELGWKDNQRNISCAPEGTYPIKLEWSPRFNMDLWELYEIPNRSEIKIHVANFYRQLNGCIAVGDLHTKIDSDEYPDVRNSRVTLGKLHAAMGGDTEAVIHIV